MNELKKSPQWVCWEKDSTRGKIPKNAKTGGNAMSNNPQTWSSYELCEKVSGNYDGVGFMFANGICGIDIDGADNPEQAKRAKDIIAHMDTYSEYSPSGNGYHLIFRCDLSRIPQKDGKLNPRYYQKNPHNGIECYISGLTNRFFTYTGEAINNLGIEDRTEQLLTFFDKYMQRKSPPSESNALGDKTKDFSLSHNNIISIAKKAKNGKNFISLFFDGDTSSYKNDDSSADIALCNILAFYCQGDSVEIDRLFRQSALMRDKWEREDYRNATINKGIAICRGEFYKPKVSKAKTSSELTQTTTTLIPSDFTDVGEALILAQEYRSRFRYSSATGYLVFNGKVWEDVQEKRNAVMQRLTTRQLKEARELEKAAQSKDEKEFAESYIKFVKSCRNNGKSKGILEQVQPHILISIDELDANPFHLNTPIGTVDLKTGSIHKHRYEDCCTKITRVSPGTKGKEIFMEALKTITQGNSELENYIQEYAGMTAVGKVYGEYLGIAYGSGANGKSTLFNALARVLGNYAGTLPAESLMVNEKGSKDWNYAELRGKRLIIAAELEEGRRLSTKALKIIASTDEIHAEKKYKDPFRFTPSHNVILYTNYLPKVGSSDDGTWRRIIAIPFEAKIIGDKDIKNYADYLFENSGEAILQWIIDGAKRFIANNYKIKHPQCVENAIKEYRDANDWITSFLDECCDIGQQYTERAGIMLEQYKRHCELTGNYKRHDGDFKVAMIQRGLDCRVTSIGKVYYGVRLKLQHDDIPSEWR